jgi:hypothetical protein
MVEDGDRLQMPPQGQAEQVETGLLAQLATADWYTVSRWSRKPPGTA